MGRLEMKESIGITNAAVLPEPGRRSNEELTEPRAL
jgi:hypothetical protein